MDKGAELEAKAISIYRQYKFFLPSPVKIFFRELADFIKWENLKKELQK